MDLRISNSHLRVVRLTRLDRTSKGLTSKDQTSRGHLREVSKVLNNNLTKHNRPQVSSHLASKEARDLPTRVPHPSRVLRIRRQRSGR